jgi:hypothetical protein
MLRSSSDFAAIRDAKLAEEARVAAELEAQEAAEKASLSDLEKVVDSIEIHSSPASDIIDTLSDTPEQPVELPAFLDLVRDISDNEELVLGMAHSLTSNLDIRMAQEAADHPDNDSIQKNLEKARKVCTTTRTAKVLLACGLASGAFVNRVWHDGSYFNVYAMSTKLASIRETLLEGVPLSNEINHAVITSMFRLEKAGIGFDFDTAKAAASDKYPPAREGVRKHLVRHTVGKSTASTQAGSTMHMLAAMGIVEIVGKGKNPNYKILDTPATRRLREVVLAA